MKISIVINNYNNARFLDEAIRSALAQTHPDTEVIAVDDGSTDDSWAILLRYADRVALRRQANGGQRAAYNTGFTMATGEFVVFLDADDWLYPEAAACIATAWRPGLSKIHWPADLVDAQGRPLGRRVPRVLHDREAKSLVQTYGVYGSAAGSANAYAAGFLRQIFPLELIDRHAADTDPIVYAPFFGDVVNIAEPLCAYRIHKRDGTSPSMLSNNAPKSLWDEVLRMLAEKRRTEVFLDRLGVEHARPLRYAPWEARLLILARRFGGPVPEGATLRALGRHAFGDLWGWPSLGLKEKLLIAGWLVAVSFLPYRMAERLAFLHRKNVGQASPASALPSRMPPTVAGSPPR